MKDKKLDLAALCLFAFIVIFMVILFHECAIQPLLENLPSAN